MKVTRKMTVETNDIWVGDQITVTLSGFGTFTATAQKVTDEGICFLFDEVIARRPMNADNTNHGGFKKSDLHNWLRNAVLPAFPEKLRSNVFDITLPTYGEIFGHDYEPNFYANFVPDEDEQFELMKYRGNRVCDFNGDWCWWWLRNATKKKVSSAGFARVANLGNANCFGASNSGGVRPEFWLAR